jgi:hypothetical protein
MRRSHWLVVTSLLLAAAAHAQPREFTVPILPQGPALKGDLSDPLWQQAARLTDFATVDEGAPAQTPTEAYVLADAQALYIAFVCHEPNMDQRVTETSGHDGPVLTDDCVEVVLDPPNGQTWAWHWAINSIGVIWDALERPGRTEGRWTNRPESSSRRAADRWTVELRFPYAAYGVTPQPGETWGLNLGRTRRAGALEVTSWSPAPSGVDDPERCGQMIFPAAAGPVQIMSLSRGGCSADANATGRNVFVCSIRNAGDQPVTADCAVAADGKPLAQSKAPIPAQQTREVRLAYAVPEGQPLLQFTVKANGQTLYATSLQAAASAPQGPKSWQLADPLYRELLGAQPPGLCREGSLVWGHLNDIRILREFARRFAVGYSEAEAYQEHADHKFILIGHSVTRSLDEPHGMARYRVRNAPCPVRLPKDVPWHLDPASIDLAISDMEDVFKGPHPLVFGIFAGDEVVDIALKEGAELARKPGDYSYIKQADAEVREQFGGGKYGIPLGLAERDPDPYKWIAFRRWVNAKMRERNQRLHDTVRRYDAQMPLISVDGGGEPGVYELSAQADLFDIFTNQHASRGQPWRCTLGYHVKVMADLTGKEVWPCAHVEHYVVGLTPEETVEELSQIWRNGGSGLHLFLPHTGAEQRLVGDTKHCLFGSPDRYHTITNIMDLIRTMPRPKLPAAGRTAILSNDDTLCAEPYDLRRPYSEQTESCYTFLGPIARSWFRFIDCAQVRQWTDLRKRFDLIWLPTARYQTPEVVARLRAFVEQGGTLVCADPQAFGNDTLGNDTSAAREALFGVKVGEKVERKQLCPKAAALGKPLALPGEAYALQPAAGVEVLAAYEDGSPALTSRRLGQGRAILFGSNPFAFTAIPDADWQRFFKAWSKQLGMSGPQDIWRFRFPDSVIWKAPPLPGVCLTNNHVLWRNEQPLTVNNLDTGGGYSLSPAPVAMPDVAAREGLIPFAAGHLTDRRTGIKSRKTRPGRGAPYALPASRWMLSWDASEAVTITFDLRQARTLRELRLWYCDVLPGVEVSGSADGQSWRKLGEAQGQVAGEDVLELHVPLAAGAPGRYVRVTIPARQAGEKLSLVEAEVWGQ